MGTFNTDLPIDAIHNLLSKKIDSIGKNLNIVRLEDESAEFKITYQRGGLILKVKLFNRNDSVIVDYEHISVNAMGMEINTSTSLRGVQEKFAELLFKELKEGMASDSKMELEGFISEYKNIEKGANLSSIRVALTIVGVMIFILLVSLISSRIGTN